MSKNSIKIDGSKLREALESKTGLTIYEIAISNGFSRNLIAEATRKGIASPIIQMIADKCGVNTEEYILKDPDPVVDPTPELKGQISIDDIETIKRDELKELFKQAIREAGFKAPELKALIKEACKEAIVEAFNGAKITKGGI